MLLLSVSVIAQTTGSKTSTKIHPFDDQGDGLKKEHNINVVSNEGPQSAIHHDSNNSKPTSLGVSGCRPHT